MAWSSGLRHQTSDTGSMWEPGLDMLHEIERETPYLTPKNFDEKRNNRKSYYSRHQTPNYKNHILQQPVLVK